MIVDMFFSLATSVLLWWLFFPASFGKHMAKVDAGRSALTQEGER